MSMDFALILLILALGSGLIIVIDSVFFAGRRKREFVQSDRETQIAKPATLKLPLLVEYSRSLFPIFLLVLLIRSFLVEPFRIPSGSLEPTLLVGDFVLVNKYDYGLRLLVAHNKMLVIGEPKRGDIVVFRWPPDPKIDYIKRFVGLPGDHIKYVNKVLTINGKVAKQKVLGLTTDNDEQGHSWKVEIRQETINGVSHKIYLRPDLPANNFDITVPPGSYFAMGDNRDDSSDSRVWGFVPEKNLVGRAILVWMSWNADTDSIRWDRLGSMLH